LSEEPGTFSYGPKKVVLKRNENLHAGTSRQEGRRQESQTGKLKRGDKNRPTKQQEKDGKK